MTGNYIIHCLWIQRISLTYLTALFHLLRLVYKNRPDHWQCALWSEKYGICFLALWNYIIILKICGSPLIFQINSARVILWSQLCISLHHYMLYFLMQNILRKTYFSVLVLCFLSLRLDGSQYVFAASSKELQLIWMKKLQNCPESASSDSDDSGWALTHGWSILIDLRQSSLSFGS